jgi:hypothetical protein
MPQTDECQYLMTMSWGGAYCSLFKGYVTDDECRPCKVAQQYDNARLYNGYRSR